MKKNMPLNDGLLNQIQSSRIKFDLENTFRVMGLVHNEKYDFWSFPSGIDSVEQFSIRDLVSMDENGDWNKTEVQVKISGPNGERWYHPKIAIMRIQELINEIFESYAQKRDS